MEDRDSGIIVKKNNAKFIIGVIFLGISFALYFCIPLIFFLPYDMKMLGSIAFGAYIVSWGLTGIAIAFMGKEGYNLIKGKVLSIFKKRKKT